MKLNKILKEVVDELLKPNGHLVFGKLEGGKIGFTTDGHRGFIVDEKDFFFDFKKTRREENMGMHTIFTEKDFKPAEKTGEIRIVHPKHNAKEVKAVKVKNSETYAWVNEKFFKDFEKDAEFTIKSPTSPVNVYENGEFVGVMLPIRVNEGE